MSKQQNYKKPLHKGNRWEHPHALSKMERPSGTGVGLSKSECLVCPFEEQCYRAIFFEEQTVKQENYLQMLKEYAFPMLRLSPGAIFQQDGAPPYWGLRVRGRLVEEFTDRWIGRGGPTA